MRLVMALAFSPIFMGMALVLVSYPLANQRLRDMATNFVTVWMAGIAAAIAIGLIVGAI